MAIEKITDSNYEGLKQAQRAVLVVGTSWCQSCRAYKPMISQLSDSIPYVAFGEVVLDEKGAAQFKKKYPGISSWTLPTTLFMRDGKEVHRFSGVHPLQTVLQTINEKLVAGSTAYVPGNNGRVAAARIKKIVGDRYFLELLEDSSLGRKNEIVELTRDEFNMNGLEKKLNGM